MVAIVASEIDRGGARRRDRERGEVAARERPSPGGRPARTALLCHVAILLHRT
jgi:hypothetical protein